MYYTGPRVIKQTGLEKRLKYNDHLENEAKNRTGVKIMTAWLQGSFWTRLQICTPAT